MIYNHLYIYTHVKLLNQYIQHAMAIGTLARMTRRMANMIKRRFMQLSLTVLMKKCVAVLCPSVADMTDQENLERGRKSTNV